MSSISSGARRSIAASVMPARSGSYGRLRTAPSASSTAGDENQAATGRMYCRSQSTTTNAQPLRSKRCLSWATISSRVRRSHSPSVAMSVGAGIVVFGDLLEQLEGGDLRRRGADLAAAEVLQLREERR